MVKKEAWLFTLLLVIFVPCVSANTYLTQNSTWDSNMTGARWASIALGDVDNNGYLDLAHIGCIGGSPCTTYLAKIYTNNGTAFEDNSTWGGNLTGVNYGSIAWGDVDNDGDLDLALTGCNNGGSTTSACSSGGHQSFIYINNGTSLVENSAWKGDITNTARGSIAFGDINLDGKLDLVLAGQGSSGTIAEVYINNGTGFAENSTWQSELTAVFQGSTTLVDMDNDGDLDLTLVGKSENGISRIYINNGSSFERNTTWDQNLLGVLKGSSAWGDFNNNGWMDLSLTGQSAGDHHRIYNNTGTTLTQVQQAGGTDQTLTPIFEGTQVFGDYGNDGNLDLFTSGEERYSTLYLYNGSPFTSGLNDPETGIFNSAFSPSAVWGDLDNDSDLDLVLVGYDSDNEVNLRAYVYINNISTSNTAPNASTDFNTSYSNTELTFQWGNASDDETAALGLYYNIKVGNASGSHKIVSGVYGGGDDNGYFGNMMQRKSITLKNLNLQQNDTIYWSVQTIDAGLKAGDWSIEQSFTLTDEENPIISLISPSNNSIDTSSQTVTFTYNVSDVSISNCSLIINNNLVKTDYSVLINTTQNIFYTLTNGNYNWSINCTDVFNQENESETRNLTVSYTAPTSDSPGGGGSGAAGTAATSETKSTGTILAGETKTISFTRDFGITDIKLTMEKKVSDTIKVEDITSSPGIYSAPVNPAQGAVYKYLSITADKVSSAMKKAVVKFKVTRNWISYNNFDENTVELRKLVSDMWKILPTKKVRADADYFYYEAETASFSKFAIIGQKKVEVIEEAEEEMPEEKPAEPTPQPPTPEEMVEEVEKFKWKKSYLWVVPIVTSLIVIAFLVVYWWGRK